MTSSPSVSQAQYLNLARAYKELLDQFHDMQREQGVRPALGRWEAVIVNEVERAGRGEYGGDAVLRGLERARERKEAERREDWHADAERQRREAAFRAEARKLGGRVRQSGVVNWPRDPGDPFGDGRRRRADAAARVALDAEAMATNGGSGT